MKPFFFIILAIGVILSFQTAYAETGQNFDREKIGPNQFQWTSHYERILDNGQFVNYKWNDNGTIITFESAGIIYKLDKASCEFSLLNPDTGQTSIIGFSHALTVNGIIEPLSACTVTNITPRLDKLDVTVFRSGASGTLQTIYEINAMGIMEWTHEITNTVLAIPTKYGVEEICEKCDGVSVGNDLISFGDYILDTKNRIHNTLKTTDDTKEDYKFVYEGTTITVGEKLVIDPTFSGAATNSYQVRTGLPGVSTACPTTGSVITPGNTQLYIEDADLNVNYCAVVAFRFDVSSIPDGISTITNSSFKTVVGSVSTPKNCDINEVLHDPATADATALWNDILNTANGTTWLNNHTWCTATGSKDLDLGTSADSGFLSLINSGTDIISIGYKYDDMTRDSTSFHEVNTLTVNTLTITYRTNPNAVTDLSALQVTGTTVTLDWSTPAVEVGNVINGYEINSTTPWGNPMTVLNPNTTNTLTTGIVSGLTELTQYSFRVSALTDTGGKNATGNILNVTTLKDFTLTNFNLTDTNPSIVPILFERNDINDTALFLNVTYSNTFHLACDFHYKFAMTNNTYTNLSNVTVDSGRVRSDFQFNGVDNEIIDVFCWNDSAGGFNATGVNSTNSGRYIITQSNFPILQQITDFRNGIYGTQGDFGVLDFVTLIVIIMAMVGLNRVNETVGAIFFVAIIGGLAFLGIIELPTIVFSLVALVIMLVVSSTRKD